MMSRLIKDVSGAMAVETAVVAPVLVLLSLGAYQVSTMVARQSELQSAIGVAESVALATVPDTADEQTTLKQIVSTTTGLPLANITVTPAYRCNAADTLVTALNLCPAGAKVSYYLEVVVTDTYKPIWREFGVGSDVALRLERMIQYSQATKA